jgi:putative transposase
VRFAWVQQHRDESCCPATIACDVLEVTRSGYYAWTTRRPQSSPRRQRHEQLVQQVRLSYLRSHGRYGAPKIATDLKRRGVAVCLNTVAKILRECGLRARPRRRFVPRTTDSSHPHPIAPNRLDRCFAVGRANAVWVGDISYIRTGQGWLYLATLMDLFSRKIVGWAMADHLRSALTCEALTMAIRRRRPAPGLICHSDRGVQYACRDYQQLLTRYGLLCSMSRRGDCYDNAPAESFFATLKGELININDYATPQEARAAVFEFIEVFYNRKRMHSALGYLSPESFEATHRAVPKPAPTDRG